LLAVDVDKSKFIETDNSSVSVTICLEVEKLKAAKTCDVKNRKNVIAVAKTKIMGINFILAGLGIRLPRRFVEL